MKNTLILILASYWLAPAALADVPSNLYEKLDELPIQQKADKLGAPIIYRLFYCPTRFMPMKPYCVKVAVQVDALGQPSTSTVYLKARLSDGTLFERSRPLTDAELQDLSREIIDQEIFSLPQEQEHLGDPVSMGTMLMDDTMLIVERYVAADRKYQTVARAAGSSKPVQSVAVQFTRLVEDFGKELDKLEAEKEKTIWESPTVGTP